MKPSPKLNSFWIGRFGKSGDPLLLSTNSRQSNENRIGPAEGTQRRGTNVMTRTVPIHIITNLMLKIRDEEGQQVNNSKLSYLKRGTFF
jgi:hypothetical protein